MRGVCIKSQLVLSVLLSKCKRVNPKFCVKSISGANRAKFIYGGSGLVRLLPF